MPLIVASLTSIQHLFAKFGLDTAENGSSRFWSRGVGWVGRFFSSAASGRNHWTRRRSPWKVKGQRFIACSACWTASFRACVYNICLFLSNINTICSCLGVHAGYTLLITIVHYYSQGSSYLETSFFSSVLATSEDVTESS